MPLDYGQIERFQLEKMLGRLARWLRIMGLESILVDYPLPPRLPGELLLTRRQALANQPRVVFICHDKLDDQLRQLAEEIGLAVPEKALFSRCLDCNLSVVPLAREEARGLVPDHTYHHAVRFTTCPQCGKVFWPGSHGDRTRARLASLGLLLPQPTQTA